VVSEPHQPSDDPTEVRLVGFRIDDLLHPDQQRRFRRLCMATSPGELKELADTVRLHLDQVRAAAAPETDLEMAEQVASSLEALIGSDQRFSGDERALIRGAVEYFLLLDDADSDLHDSLGFDDDARVVNSVLDHVGRRDLRVLF
jgi:hypothetical protein